MYALGMYGLPCLLDRPRRFSSLMNRDSVESSPPARSSLSIHSSLFNIHLSYVEGQAELVLTKYPCQSHHCLHLPGKIAAPFAFL